MRSVGVLLAAGAGRRFDSRQPGAKLDALFDGETVGVRALLSLSAAADRVIAVTRTLDSPLALRAAQLGARVIVPISGSAGMGHSIAAAAEQASSEFSDAEVLVLALADMPWVQPETLRLLIGHGAAEFIVRPRFGGSVGHPVVFGRSFWAELSACAGDQGARQLLAAHASRVRYVDVPDSGILCDVDVPDDLRCAPASPRQIRAQ